MIGLPLQMQLPGVKVRESPRCHGWEATELNAGRRAGPEPDSHSGSLASTPRFSDQPCGSGFQRAAGGTS